MESAWVQRFRTSIRYPNIRSNRDGYFGVDYPPDMFRIAGSGLNWAFMIPSHNVIALRISRASNNQWDAVQEEFLAKLFAAISER